MDLVGTKNDLVLAIEAGQVSYVGYDKTGGNWISITTNGIEHRYFHLANNSIKVKKNDYVKKGEVIGQMGATGNATGPNVHFAIYKNGYIDPLPYLMNEDPFNLNNESYKTFIKEVKEVLNIKTDNLQEILNNTITISRKINNKHPLVKVIQKYLQSLGYDLGKFGLDGQYGPQMEKIVKEYQKNIVKLKNNFIDGVITKRMYTWKSLLKLN